MKRSLSVFEIARAGLVKDRTLMFFTSVLLQTKFVVDDTQPTAWTDMVQIGYNETFIESVGVPTARFVIIHEILHVVLKHGLRRGSRDPARWNDACLEASTQVRMADGSLRPISSIRQGEKVWSPSGPSTVLANIDRGIKPLMKLGTVLCTPDHRFLTEKGFVDASSLDTGVHGALLRETGRTDVRPGELQEHVDSTTITSDRREIYDSSPGSLQEGTASRSLCESGRSLSDRRESLGVRASLLSRDHRRRRDAGDPEAGELLPAIDHDFQHVRSSEGMVGSARLSSMVGQEQQRPPILAHNLGRIYHRQATDALAAILGYQSPSLQSAFRVHLDTQRLVEKGGRDGSYARDCLRDSLAKRAWATCAHTGAEGRVFDLVTEHHVFAAGGFLTHNCDYAINIMLFDLKFAIWERAFIDSKYRGMSAEQIYALREQEQKQEGQGQGQGGLGGDLRPPPAITPEQVAKIDHEISKTLARASAIARQHGVMPAGLEMAVGAAYEDPVPWEQVLIDYMTVHVAQDENWSKRNRRYSEVILPSHKSDGMDELVVIADSSGSMFNKQVFERVAVAINHIVSVIKPLTTRIIWADDTDCANMEIFEPGDEVVLHAKGGGGTDLRKPLKFVEQYRPEVVLLLTDGYTPWNDFAPPYPLIIACTTNAPCPDYAGIVRITVD